MHTPEKLQEHDLGPITWTDDPNKAMLRGYQVEQQTLSRYTLASKPPCLCDENTIVVNKGVLLAICRCTVKVIGECSVPEYIYESSLNQHRHIYNQEKARPIRVPEGYKFIGLKSDTGTGKTRQADVLLRALFYGQHSKYHTEKEKQELIKLRISLGPDPGCIFIGPRTLYDIEMVRKLRAHGARLYKDQEKYESAPVWVWQFHSLWKFNRRVPKIVVIDEAELNRKTWTDSLNREKQHKNQEMLEFLIQQADLVLVMDATLSLETVDVIRGMDANSKWLIQENTFKSNLGAKVRVHRTQASITDRCIMDMSAGKVISISSGSLTQLDAFRECVFARLPVDLEVKHKTFNSKTPRRLEDFEKGLDKALGIEFTMLLYTGSMGVGVEYTLSHVDKRFMLVNYNMIGADGYLQFLGRVRSPKDSTVEMFIQKPMRDTRLPVTRSAIISQISVEIEANHYRRTYFSPQLDPTTRLIEWVCPRKWVYEALIVNTMQTNRSLNNMEHELFSLLRITGYKIIENVLDEFLGDAGRGCKQLCLDLADVAPEQPSNIEAYINGLTYNEQVTLNLQYWSKQNVGLKGKYVRYRVEFPHHPATMAAYAEIECKRPQLFNIACMLKLSDHNALQAYLVRENQNMYLENTLHKLIAMRILFGALLGEYDKSAVACLKLPPEKLDGHIIHANVQGILAEIRNTNLVRLNGLRVRSVNLRERLKNTSQCSENSIQLIRSLIGLVNQATRELFACTYVEFQRYQHEDKRYQSWKLYPIRLMGTTIIELALNSELCNDTEFPGHPRIPTPMDGLFE